MSLANQNQAEQAAYPQHTAFVGADDSTLIFASETNWMECPADYLILACEHGWTELDEMR